MHKVALSVRFQVNIWREEGSSPFRKQSNNREGIGCQGVEMLATGRRGIDDHELTEKFYKQSKVLIAGYAPPSRDASQLYPKGGLSN
jgi:hypothetical protein